MINEQSPYEYRQAILNEKGEFIWNELRDKAAALLAQGYQKTYVADQVGVSRKTIYNWLEQDDFQLAIDELSLMLGIASKAYRLRLMNQALQQFIDQNGTIDISGFTLLDLLKEARMQTEGVKLGIVSELAPLIEEEASVDRRRQERSGRLLEVETKDTE